MLSKYGEAEQIQNQIEALRELGRDPNNFLRLLEQIDPNVAKRLIDTISERIPNRIDEETLKELQEYRNRARIQELIEVGYLQPRDEFEGSDEDYEKYKNKILRIFGRERKEPEADYMTYIKKLESEIAELKRAKASETPKTVVNESQNNEIIQQRQDSIIQAGVSLLEMELGSKPYFIELAQKTISSDPDFQDAYTRGDIAKAMRVIKAGIEKTKKAIAPKVSSKIVPNPAGNSPEAKKQVEVKDANSFAEAVVNSMFQS